MGIIDYVKSCISGLESSGIEQVMSIIALVLLGFFALSMLLRMFKGFRKGARRQVLSTVMILISIGIAMILTRITSSFLVNLVTVENIQKLATDLGINSESVSAYIDILTDFPEATLQYLLSIPVAVILAPILFLAIYMVVRFITYIIQIIIKSAADVKAPANIGERFAGLCLGAVEGIIIASVTIIPITSVISFADEIITTLSSNESETADGEDTVFDEFKETYTTYIEPAVIDNPALWLANNGTNDSIVSTISHVSTNNGTSENIREEFIDVIEIVFVEIPELKDVDFVEPDENEKALIENLINRLAENEIVTTILSGTISTTATIMDPKTFGLDLEPPLDSVVRDVTEILKTCTPETLKEDMHLIKNVYFLLADEHILLNIDDSDLLLDALITKDEGEEKNAVQKLIALINENERTKPLITTLTKLSITMLASGLGDTEFDVDQKYEDLKNTMNDVLAVNSEDYETHEEYIEEVTNVLDTNLRNNGIEIEDREIVTSIAEYIDENYGESSELSDEEFNDVLLSYFDAYIEYQNSGTIPDNIPGLNPDDIPDNIPGGSPDNGDFDPDSSNPQP